MRKLVAPVIGAIATVFLLVPQADAKDKWVDIRVVGSDGIQLADQRQYSDDVKVKASEEADCFGESNPSSDSTYRLSKPNALGALVEAAKVNGNLAPLLITDAFFGSFGSFGVCGIGSHVGSDVFGEEYWYSAVNGVGATTGPNLIPVENGDRHLWYFATGAETAISELVLDAPARVLPGEPFEVKVTRVNPDGSKEPAQGASVTGDVGPTAPDGTTDVILGENSRLVASGGSDDVVSAALLVCVNEDLSKCPKRRGKLIVGTNGDNEMRGTKGADGFNCRGGRDIVRGVQLSDNVSSNCEKVKRA